MLLNITIENFRSYNEPQTLSLIASENNGVNSVAISDIEVRKSAVIYGANASGKSNIIKAVQFVQWLLGSGLLLQKSLNLQYMTTFFNNDLPVRISLDYSINDVIYTYKIHCRTSYIEYEALLNEQEEIIFERKLLDVDDLKYEYIVPSKNYSLIFNTEQMEFAENNIRNWKNNIRSSQLFLKKLVENNCKQMEEIYKYILYGIVVRTHSYNSIGKPTTGYNDLFNAASQSKQDSNFALNSINALNNIGVKINQLNIEQVGDDGSFMPGDIIGSLKKMSSQYNVNGKDCWLDFIYDESDGTQKFYSYLYLIDYVIKTDGVLIIDELETHFHPLLVEEIIRAIHNSHSKAQLIFTTHNPTFLTESIFEKDQIYFAEKNDKFATELYSLSDFNDLEENANLMAKYLTGNFGAIPYLNSFNFNGGNNG